MAIVSALVAEARGESAEAAPAFGAAASGWREFDVPYEEGHALLGRLRCLLTVRASEAAAPLGAARDIFARLAAKPALAETDKLMQKVRST